MQQLNYLLNNTIVFIPGQTNVNQPLKEHQSKPTKNKEKYCALCSRRGHTADQCNVVNAKYPLSPMQVASYRPLYNVNNAPKIVNTKQFTILTSSVGNYTFNFGHEVSDRGNRIYARFRQAVNLHVPRDTHTSSRLSAESVEVLESTHDEYNAPDSSIEIDAETSAMLDALEWLPDTSFDQGAVEIIDSDKSEFDKSVELIEPRHVDDALQNVAIDLAADKPIAHDSPALGEWEQKLQTLTDLKAKILQTPPKSSEVVHPSVHRDEKDESDSNYSFSEHFNQSPTKKYAILTTNEPNYLPDFIPLPENRARSRSRSQSPVSADTTTDSLGDANCDATIHLTKAHCNHLIKPHGSEALRGLETKNSVTVEMEWRSTGNVLKVNGTPANQDNFHKDLTEFLKTLVETGNNNNSTMLRVPKQRHLMINFLREHLRMLDTPSYYNRDLRKVHQTMLAALANNNKRGVKEAYRCRRILNSVLFGRHGFDDGEMHMIGLQELLTKLLKTRSNNLSKVQFNDLGKHFEYIFTEFDHKNYPDLLDQYYNMKVAKALRVLNIDRRLLGFPISVVPTPPPPPSLAPSAAPESKRLCLGQSSDETITSTQFNTMPSSNDIQLNVSSSSMNY